MIPHTGNTINVCKLYANLLHTIYAIAITYCISLVCFTDSWYASKCAELDKEVSVGKHTSQNQAETISLWPVFRLQMLREQEGAHTQ